MTGIDWTGAFEDMDDLPKPSQPEQDRDADWPKLEQAAFNGLAGEVVTRILPSTESDPAALLLQYLACYGNAIGRQPYYQVEGTRHFTNVFTVLVGETSESAKARRPIESCPSFTMPTRAGRLSVSPAACRRARD